MKKTYSGHAAAKGRHLRDLVGALVVGAVLAVPVVVLLGSAPVVLRATFQGPVDDAQVGALLAWAEAEPGLDAPRVARDGKAVVLEARRRGALRSAVVPPWKDLGFPPLHTLSMQNRFDPVALAADPVFLIAMLLGAQAGFLVVAIVVRRRAGDALPALHAGPVASPLLWGVATGLLLAAFGWLYGRLVSTDQPWNAVRELGPGPRAAVVAGGVLLAPVCEELFFRGLLFARFLAAGRVVGGAIASALLFAAVHVTPAALPAIFLFGLAFAWLYRARGSILAPIAAHATNNAIAFTLLLG